MKILSPSYIIPLIIAMGLCIGLEANLQVGLITSTIYVGDREVAWRIKIAGERLGWNVFLDERDGSQIVDQELDFVVCMLPENDFINPSCPNYLMVFHPFTYLNKQRRFNPFYEKYDGYLLTINDRETLRTGLRLKNKEFHHIPFYPTVYSVPYQKLTFDSLVVMIPVWSNRLTDPKFRSLYSLLSGTGFAKFYGVYLNQEIAAEHYMGTIPFDGASVIHVLQQHGIALVIHSDIHNKECIPSSRIFEAAAASTVVISDENPFVKKHFGDSVFYIDTSASTTNIFSQILGHMHTIRQNPTKAREMARKAHQIFIRNFTMENQLLQLEELNRKVQSNTTCK
jgi:hypothetical protein